VALQEDTFSATFLVDNMELINDQKNWSVLGYDSKIQQEAITLITSPLTSPTVRRAMIAALLIHPPESEPKKKSRIFFSYSMAKVEPTASETEPFLISLAPRLARFPFPINDSLPFIDLPIGRVRDKENDRHIYFRGLVDTGGCCTMAWKPYMLRLMAKFPEFVSEHTVLNESQFEDIKIGGIQGGVWITETIVFYLPFVATNNGEKLGIMFGLTGDLPINILYGIPFLIEAQITLDMDTQTATSRALGTTFEIHMMPPTRSALDSIDYKVGSKATFHGSRKND
jgi:hypothetical protein